MSDHTVFKAAQRIAALFVEHASAIPGVWFDDSVVLPTATNEEYDRAKAQWKAFERTTP